jgi:glucose-6-phosphate 1-epimerase
LTFALHSSAETAKLAARVHPLCPLKLGKTCEIELEAHGEFETTSALHTYFNVGDIAAVKVSGLGERYIDKVKNAEEGVEQRRADLPGSYRPRLSEPKPAA